MIKSSKKMICGKWSQGFQGLPVCNSLIVYKNISVVPTHFGTYFLLLL